jgi:hypothetical protein
MQLSRSVFLKRASLLGIGGLLLGNLKTLGADNLLNAPPLKKRVLRVAHLTDVHMKPELVSEKGFANALNAVNNLQDKPDCLVLK